MVTLSPKQFAVLVRLSKSPIRSVTGLKPREFRILCFLCDCGYAEIQTRIPAEAIKDSNFRSAETTESGMSYLFSAIRNLFCFFVPVVISICSLILSVISIAA